MCRRHRRNPGARAGMSLPELLISITIMTLIAGVVGVMAMAVQTTSEYARGQSIALQHGRVVLDRIDRTLQSATISESFPGFMVVSWPDGSGSFPDTLVIWKPTTTAIDPTGVPRANELVIVRPDPVNPSSLLEITNPSEAATPCWPATSANAADWRTLITTLTSRTNAVEVELTNMVRIAATSTSSVPNLRGALRIRYCSAPSDTELANYRAGSASWTNLAWPQDRAGKTMGLRSIACFVELQLAPDETNDSSDNVLPCFGSTVLWKEVIR